MTQNRVGWRSTVEALLEKISWERSQRFLILMAPAEEDGPEQCTLMAPAEEDGPEESILKKRCGNPIGVEKLTEKSKIPDGHGPSWGRWPRTEHAGEALWNPYVPPELKRNKSRKSSQTYWCWQTTECHELSKGICPFVFVMLKCLFLTIKCLWL